MPRPAPNSPFPRLLRRWLGRERPQGVSAAALREDPLLQAGRVLRQRREERGLNLRQLALETRISTPVLEAIERGWRDRLPESTYLRTMLPLIEEHLELPRGSLQVALPPDEVEQEGRRRMVLLGRFTPGSIDVFTTWQGTVLYGVITLGLIYGLNLQQQQLATAQMLSLRPIPPLAPAEQARSGDPGGLLLQIQPGLRPLGQAELGQGQSALAQLGPRSPQAGVLRLQLAQPSRVLLSSASGERSQLSGASGEVVVQLLPPFDLQLSPAPTAPAVFWDGQPLAPLRKQPGQYRYPLPAPDRPVEAANPSRP
ncbi:RodZ family helix-turn-helix domain-containing protein [Cyanobium sp. Morenito 9A2]|uniref:helix-turn-helix domain-containing protein n=1 Tax=Cyanobium sp. Morenito 9A2 TaxID=2823718 RepID=UPI0020CF6C6B|nr:helix-turn-helix transcriptional regulator [Cyanobium sp. Morenito 9A2]MCP9848388.1 helix-turn-helix domain-containing protein [Cyanobium sp. Morenito 9A2]